MNLRRFSSHGLLASVVMALASSSCSSSGDEEGGGSGSGNGGSGAVFFGDGGSNASGGLPGSWGGESAGLLEGVDGRAGSSSGSSSVVPILPGAECAGEQFVGEAIPLEIHIMMDRSISMGDSEERFLLPGGGTKWEAVRTGFEDFFDLPQVQSMSAGIAYFGQETCEADQYATPEVEIGPVADTASDILASYDDRSPGGNTPMGPALEGALMHARDYKSDNPGTEVAVVLVTDGVPNGCGATTDDPRGGADSIAPIAADFANGSPSVPTYVLGIEGIEVSAADFRYVVTEIARAGGTMPVVIQATDDLAQKFAEALESIRAAAAPPCSYSVPLPPAGDTLDLDRVNVALLPQGSGAEPILNVPDADHCEHGGWYYDPPGDPQSINLCENTCNVVSTLTGAGFAVLFGCDTVVQIM